MKPIILFAIMYLCKFEFFLSVFSSSALLVAWPIYAKYKIRGPGDGILSAVYIDGVTCRSS